MLGMKNFDSPSTFKIGLSLKKKKAMLRHDAHRTGIGDGRRHAFTSRSMCGMSPKDKCRNTDVRELCSLKEDVVVNRVERGRVDIQYRTGCELPDVLCWINQHCYFAVTMPALTALL
ncbi:hypothetical protein EVAR_96261_1 [Eumeta japonica]|uniref:Uncharacterized protein n=1 Tax=Eumeta variegata TaxID=151549 RepID=A0A4C1WLL3_EUMVA|nr:hypothetical protein EVAR_96261_1 [Eumeta japonica]